MTPLQIRVMGYEIDARILVYDTVKARKYAQALCDISGQNCAFLIKGHTERFLEVLTPKPTRSLALL